MVSLSTYLRWLRTGKPNPTAVKLLAVLAGYVPWQGWDGWEMHNSYLFPPGYNRNGFSSGHIFAMHFERQAFAQLKHELEESKEANRAQAEASVSAPPAARNFKLHLVK